MTQTLKIITIPHKPAVLNGFNVVYLFTHPFSAVSANGLLSKHHATKPVPSLSLVISD